jgi:hypothetical protein
LRRLVARFDDGNHVAMERSELKSRLLGLGAGIADRLTVDRQEWFADFVRVGEYALALEMMAEWLSEDELPITVSERAEARILAEAMGIIDRVMGPLSLCP